MGDKIAITIVCGGIIAFIAVMTWGSVSFAVSAVDTIRLQDRIQDADCHVVAHTDVAQKVAKDEVLYQSGLVVDFVTRAGLSIVNATALTNIEPRNAWISSGERRRLFADHPINSTVRCFYDPETPHDAVALSGELAGSPWIKLGFPIVGALLLGAPAIVAVLFIALLALALVYHMVALAARGCQHVWRRAQVWRSVPISYDAQTNTADDEQDAVL